MSVILSWYPSTRIVILRTCSSDETFASISIGVRWCKGKCKTRHFVRLMTNNLIYLMSDLENANRQINYPRSNQWIVDSDEYFVLSNPAVDDYTLLNLLIANLTIINTNSFPICSIKERSRLTCDSFLVISLPTVNFNSGGPLTFIRHADTFTFLACGETFSTNISFWGFVTAFDAFTWIFLLFSYVGAKLLVIKISYPTLSRKGKSARKKYVIAILSSIDTLLEQSDMIWKNKRKALYVYWISTPLILTGVILSNLYRGENISSLSAPLRKVPLETYDDLIQFNYTLFSKIHPSLTNILRQELRQHPQNYTMKIFKGWTEFTHDALGFDSSVISKADFTREFRERIHFDEAETLALSRRSSGKYSLFTRLEKCDNVGVVGWRSALEKVFHKLRIQLNSDKATVSAGWARSDAVLFMKYYGWSFRSWINPKIFQNLAFLMQSGISDQLLQSSLERDQQSSFSNDINAGGTEGLDIAGNILSVFIVLSLGLFCSVFLIIFEVFYYGFLGKKRNLSDKITKEVTV